MRRQFSDEQLKLIILLAERGYWPDDIEKIMFRNWVRFVRDAWRL